MASKTPTSDDPNSTGTLSIQQSASGSQPVVMVQGQRSLQEETKYWSECIRQWFPDLLNTTYFVPPVHFNRVPYDVTSIAGQDVLVASHPIGRAGTGQGQSIQAVSKGRKGKRDGQQTSQFNTFQQPSRVNPTQQTSQVNTLQQTSQVSTSQQTSQVNTGQSGSMWSSTDLSTGPSCPVLDSDVRDDRAMTHLLCRLQEMANDKNEVMMVMTDYKFSNYLKKLTTDIASQLPRPSLQGDFDLLIIHREYGLLVGELKSVGANRKELRMSAQDFLRSIGKKIVQAARQVKKALEVVQHLVSDIAPGMTCHASLILPYVTTRELRQFLQVIHESAKKDLCECLACPDKTDLTDFFLCADHLSTESDLSCWYQGWKARNGVQPLMSDDLYQLIVARFTYVKKIRFHSLCDQLVVRVPHLHLWAASLYHKFRPRVLQEEKLTTALRCPPVIVQKVRQAENIDKDKSVYDYSHTEIPAPTHGPPILRLIHSLDGHDGHTATEYTHDCEQCGTNLAGELKKLNVGACSSSSSTADNNTSSPLMYRDVFVLSGHPDLIRRDDGFVQGLLKAGIPVQVLNDDVDVRDMTLRLHDRVTLACCDDVQGLERKVVVVLQTDDWLDLLCSASRCTSQLIWIENKSSWDLSVEVDSNDDDDDDIDVQNDNTDEDNTDQADTS